MRYERLPDGLEPARCRLFQRRRNVTRVMGLTAPLAFGVYNNSLVNLERGLIERVMLVPGPRGLEPPPETSHRIFFSRLKSTLTALARHLPSTAPIPRETFPRLYRGRKQTIYQRAVESLQRRGLTDRDARIKAFLKCEKVLFRDAAGACLDKAPRIINPRSPRYNVEVGRYLKLLEKRIFKSITGLYDGSPTVFKGMNAAEQATALYELFTSFTDPVAFCSDFHRFDQHVSRIALQWEHLVYLKCFHGSDRARLAYLLQLQLENRGIAHANDGAVRFKVEGRRMSGDMNTGMGNCLLVSCMYHAYLKHLGIKAKLANNGDDCVVIMERRDAARFREGAWKWFHSMGFNLALEDPVDVFEKISFCQTNPVWTPSGWVMVRTGLASLVKDVTSYVGLPSEKAVRTYFSEIGVMGLSCAGGIPVAQEVYNQLAAIGEGRRTKSQITSGLKWISAGMTRTYGPVHPLTRVSYWRAFGIAPAMQEALEEEVRTWSFAYDRSEPVCHCPPTDTSLISRIPPGFR